ncbi:sigma-70 RNA polymerase sigma factor region 4 domain-containing protein [Streptomyces winkii]|uniref:sigma-70 family RNA polymerase sigma factor n=1 Tax=Streptomyces winkii TaxID=3051178 RepID=UPI0028D53081|nr:sigma-70 family RNA polymerase sigma factor [Streptomyces sp. DSM 40971]
MDHRTDRYGAGAPAAPPPGPLRRLVAAECDAEAAAAGTDPEELQQAVWLRWLEARGREPARGTRSRPAVSAAGDALGAAGPSPRWLRGAVRAEARRARRRSSREIPLPDGGLAGTGGADVTVLAAEQRRLLGAAVARLPEPCPALMRALFSGRDLTYPEIAGELGMSQGSVGPVRSRCLGCLRRMLTASDCGT